ncbi:MAG: methylated-DNA--[protein]-cysteine S-methyltransferase [Saprospiraceae bacterium]|nr:methylated-DNA--[protein]-cysteine S-methyltransferase [Saprospiraceae bacterium]
MENIEICYHKTQYGELVIGTYENQLCLCDWKFRKMRTVIDHRIKTTLDSTFDLQENDLQLKTKKQLDEYFRKERNSFDLPLLMLGTDFQISVWNKLIEIPYGTTISYLKLAQNINNVKAIRAVATANGANAISIIIPCHRVVGHDGEMVGYAGGITVKKALLTLEAGVKDQLSLF